MATGAGAVVVARRRLAISRASRDAARWRVSRRRSFTRFSDICMIRLLYASTGLLRHVGDILDNPSRRLLRITPQAVKRFALGSGQHLDLAPGAGRGGEPGVGGEQGRPERLGQGDPAPANNHGRASGLATRLNVH